MLGDRLATIVADERSLDDPALSTAAAGAERRAGEHHLAQLAERDAGGVCDLGQQAGRCQAWDRVDLEDELVARVTHHHVDTRGAATTKRRMGALCMREQAAIP